MNLQADGKLAVIGGGSWGTALAVHAAHGGPVSLWMRREARADHVRATRENDLYLPGIEIPDNVSIHSDLTEAVAGAEAILLAVPTQSLRAVLTSIPQTAWPDGPVILANKGIELKTLELPTKIVAEALGEKAGAQTVVFSGPSFATELASSQPTAVVAASASPEAATYTQRRMSHGSLRVYTTDDVIGVQVAAALKNVIAIAAGVAKGLGYGHNTQAALITRSMAEISRLVVAMGGDPRTIAGLAGIGDLLLTSTGSLSRNRRVGLRLGEGARLEDVLSEMSQVAEGVPTTRAAIELAEKHEVELPIVEQVHAILFEKVDPREALDILLSRPLRSELEDRVP